MNIETTSNESVNTQATPETSSQPATVQPTAVTNEGTDFLSTISEDHRSLIENKGFKSTNDIVKSYANLEKMVGGSVRIPQSDASDELKQEFYSKLKDVDNIIVKPNSQEGMEDFYKKLGRPDNTEGYDLNGIMDQESIDSINKNPDSLAAYNTELEGYKQLAFEAGLTNDQAKIIAKHRTDDIQKQQQQDTIDRQQGEDSLRKLWGQDYDNRLAMAKSTAKMFAEKHPEAVSNLITGSSKDNPIILSMMAELGKSYQEQGHTGNQGVNFKTTPQEAIDKISTKRSDKGFMEKYRNHANPGHKQAIQELNNLYGIAYDNK